MTISQVSEQIKSAHFQLQSMAFFIKGAFKKALQSLVVNDTYAMRMIIEGDKTANTYEIEIDNISYSILEGSLDKITSQDLRHIITIQKINPILERIGDHVVNIAESSYFLPKEPHGYMQFGIDKMASSCQNILSSAIKSYFDKSYETAREVLTSDDTVDKMNITIVEAIKNSQLLSSPGPLFEAGFALIIICKNLERISDLSMNIAEEALYLIEGQTAKHQDCQPYTNSQ